MYARLSADEARALALRAQHFGEPALGEPIDLLDKLGAIQMDSVNILARNHLLVPFARLGRYSTQALQKSIYTDNMTMRVFRVPLDDPENPTVVAGAPTMAPRAPRYLPAEPRAGASATGRSRSRPPARLRPLPR